MAWSRSHRGAQQGVTDAERHSVPTDRAGLEPQPLLRLLEPGGIGLPVPQDVLLHLGHGLAVLEARRGNNVCTMGDLGLRRGESGDTKWT